MKQFDWLRSQGGLTRRFGIYSVLVVGVLGVAFVITAKGADTKAGTDMITFVNGDQLTGTVVSESGGAVTFHSNMSGDIKVGWDKISHCIQARRSP
jgi:hypothetical protein